jgi:hypothetical protein
MSDTTLPFQKSHADRPRSPSLFSPSFSPEPRRVPKFPDVEAPSPGAKAKPDCALPEAPNSDNDLESIGQRPRWTHWRSFSDPQARFDASVLFCFNEANAQQACGEDISAHEDFISLQDALAMFNGRVDDRFLAPDALETGSSEGNDMDNHSPVSVPSSGNGEEFEWLDWTTGTPGSPDRDSAMARRTSTLNEDSAVPSSPPLDLLSGSLETPHLATRPFGLPQVDEARHIYGPLTPTTGDPGRRPSPLPFDEVHFRTHRDSLPLARARLLVVGGILPGTQHRDSLALARKNRKQWRRKRKETPSTGPDACMPPQKGF